MDGREKGGGGRGEIWELGGETQTGTGKSSKGRRRAEVEGIPLSF
jgi:hypothetical protein